jgi:hypothetical protein
MEGKGLLRSSSLKDGGAGSSLRGDVPVYALHVPMLRGMHSTRDALRMHVRTEGRKEERRSSLCSIPTTTGWGCIRKDVRT